MRRDHFMRSNLAELDDLVDQHVANENELPRIAVGDPTRLIAGFVVPDTDARETNLSERRTAINSYRAARLKIAEKMEHAGIKPLAMLPAKTWNQICVETGLYRMVPDKDGQITIDGRGLPLFTFIGMGLNALFWAMFPVAWYVFTVYCATGWGKYPTTSNVMAVLLGVAIVVMGIVFYNVKWCPYISMYGVFTRLAARLLDLAPHAWVARYFLPTRTSPAPGVAYALPAKINLPAPPNDTAEVLRRIAVTNRNLQVAVVEKGFAFAEPPSRIITQNMRKRVNGLQRKWQDKEIFILLLDFDPIVYFIENGVAVIVAQFGDFPVEREVVERICQSPEYLF